MFVRNYIMFVTFLSFLILYNATNVSFLILNNNYDFSFIIIIIVHSYYVHHITHNDVVSELCDILYKTNNIGK